MHSEALKKYWPYIVGAIVGLYLISKYMGGSSSSGSTDYASFLNAQNAAAAQAAQIGIAQQQLQNQTDLQNAQIQLASQAEQDAAQATYMQAQGQLASQVTAASSGVIAALYQPAITAINAAGVYNGQVAQAAAQVAVGGFQSQASMIQSESQTLQAAAQGLNTFGVIAQVVNQPSAAATATQQPKSNPTSLYGPGSFGNTGLFGYGSPGFQ